MTSEEIKKRYTRVAKHGENYVVEFMVVPQYFTVFNTDEGREHAEHFQGVLVQAIERLIMEAVHDALNELDIQ